ncbi:hypothetical protein DK853_41055, partial [Klebsiella oxytoca]
MKQKNADALIAKLKRKTREKILTKEDLAPLLLTPLMAGKSSVKERLLTARELLCTENVFLTKLDKQHM